jgi:hypothetical protein
MARYKSFDATKYQHSIGVVATETRQMFRVDLEGLYDRDVADKLLRNNVDPPLPKKYDVRPGFPQQVCQDTTFRQIDDAPNIWEVYVEWKTITNLQQKVQDPSKRPVLIETGTYRYQHSPTQDLDGKPVTTSAGEPIDYVQQKAAPTYTFYKNYAEYPTKLGYIRDLVNTDKVQFLGMEFKPYQLYIPEIKISVFQYENEYGFFSMTCTAYVNNEKNGWKINLRNAGFHELNLVRTVRKPVPDDPKNPFGTYTVKDVPVYEYTAIRMGSPGQYVYPARPCLLTPEGRAFRQVTDSDTAQWKATNALIQQFGGRPKPPLKQGYGTGPVMGLQGPDAATTNQIGISQADFDAATLEFTFLNEVKFNGLIPLL